MTYLSYMTYIYNIWCITWQSIVAPLIITRASLSKATQSRNFLHSFNLQFNFYFGFLWYNSERYELFCMMLTFILANRFPLFKSSCTRPTSPLFMRPSGALSHSLMYVWTRQKTLRMVTHKDDKTILGYACLCLEGCNFATILFRICCIRSGFDNPIVDHRYGITVTKFHANDSFTHGSTDKSFLWIWQKSSLSVIAETNCRTNMVDDNNLLAMMAGWLEHKPKADPYVYIFRSSKHYKIAFKTLTLIPYCKSRI